MNLADLFIAKKLAGGGGGGTGTDNYNDLSNKPQINSTALTGDKSASDLGLQSEIDSDNKISADYVDDTSTSNKFVSAAEKLAWSGKQDAIDADHKIDADYVDDTTSDNKFVTASDKTAWNAKQNAIDSSHKLSSDLVDDTGHTNLFVTSTEKSTWSGKQDKIDSSHKLSSTLVSFDSSEAAALASGIDSSKVGQISTNQTNILYVANKTGKNLLKLGSFSSPSGITYTVNADNSITINKPAAISNNEWRAIGTVTLKAGTYVLSGVGATGLDASRFKLSDDHGWNQWNDTYTQAVKTVTEETTITIYINILAATTLNNVTIYPMVCTQEDWNIGHDYAMYALQNYDLTRLEAEDRAELVELVDSGAKNLFSDNNVSDVVGLTWNSSTGTATQSATDTQSNLRLKLQCRNGSSGNFTELFNNQVITSNGVVSFEFTCPTAVTQLRFGHNGSQADATMILTGFNLQANTKYYIQCNVINCVQASGAYSWNKIMLCTKAAFGVSPAFVKYCKPLASKKDHTYSLGSSIDLNTVLSDGSYMCNPSANSPVSGLCFLSVVNDGSTDLQQTLQKLNNPETIYIRHRRYQSSSPYYSWTSWFAFTGTVVS